MTKMNRNSTQFIRPVTQFKNDRLIGEASVGIKILLEHGYPVPLTHVCSSEAYDEYLRNGSCLMTNLEEELRRKLDLRESYSIRASAILEDGQSQPPAGQFVASNVRGVAQILESIQKVWESSKPNCLAAYPAKPSILSGKPRMAAIIQRMVEARTSGVVLTRNPLNGCDEVILEAVSGVGDSLLQDGVTPYRGVFKWGEWVEEPEIPGMPLELIEDVVRKATTLAKKRRAPLNLEWTYDGHSLYWLQLQRITLSSGVNFYSNKMAKEFLPGIIKPLVWSVNIPVVCGAWVRLLTELVGDLGVTPQDLAKSFYYRAYFNMGVIGDVFDAFGMPREGLEVLMGYGANAPEKPSLKPGPKSLKHLPRLMLFAIDKFFFGRKMRRFIREGEDMSGGVRRETPETLDERNTIGALERLCKDNENAAYFVIVSMLLSALYNRLLLNQLEKRGWTLGDLRTGYADYRDIDPHWGIWNLHQKYVKLPQNVRRELHILLASEEGREQDADLSSFRRDLADFMHRFGHLRDQGNDFSNAPWREQPQLVLTMVSQQDGSGYHSAKKAARETVGRAGFGLSWAYQKARKHQEYKDRISFIYTRRYGQFRPYFLHLAKLLKTRGLITNVDDIFYLTFDEIKRVVEDGRLSDELSSKLVRRKREILEYEEVHLPEVIYGDSAPAPVIRKEGAKILKGIPASGGYYSGNTCVVRGAHDFSKVTVGVVLVIPFSDISWTPIFARAGAVISESGGVLSHSAIISREYGIPSVVGVKGACELGDGRRVHVDGFSGRVVLC
jgi:phosphohistidine swiveling domain-containing protein